jgi:hypothetical protein
LSGERPMAGAARQHTGSDLSCRRRDCRRPRRQSAGRDPFGAVSGHAHADDPDQQNRKRQFERGYVELLRTKLKPPTMRRIASTSPSHAVQRGASGAMKIRRDQERVVRRLLPDVGGRDVRIDAFPVTPSTRWRCGAQPNSALTNDPFSSCTRGASSLGDVRDRRADSSSRRPPPGPPGVG